MWRNMQGTWQQQLGQTGIQELHIIDEAFNLIGIIVYFQSLRIKRSHYGVGEFELHMHPADTGAEALAVDRILFPVGRPDKAMLIESLARRENKDELIAKGRMLKGLTARRICVPPESASATYGYDRITADAESVLHHYVRNNLVAPEDAKRRMDCIALGENLKRGMQIPWEARFEALDVLLGEIAEYADMGWDILPDFEAKRFVFEANPGRDLSQENMDGGRVTFAIKLGNTIATAYAMSVRDARTTAYVGGSGEDENRIILAVGTDAQGLTRREIWVDAGGQEAAEGLQYEGARRLSEHKQLETITCEVLDRGPMRYGREWDLGDLVTIVTARAQMSARIIMIDEAYESGGVFNLHVTFGDPPRDIIRYVLNKTKQRIV